MIWPGIAKHMAVTTSRPTGDSRGASKARRVTRRLQSRRLISNVARQPGARLAIGSPCVTEGGTIRVLEVDPELGLSVPVAEIARARQSLLARLRVFEPGIHEIPRDEGPRGYLGYWIV